MDISMNVGELLGNLQLQRRFARGIRSQGTQDIRPLEQCLTPNFGRWRLRELLLAPIKRK